MKPTLNQKRRYIVFNVSHRINEDEMIRVIDETVSRFSGQYGSAEAGCRLVYFNGNWGIIRAGLKQVDMVKTSMLFIENIENKEVNIMLPFVGATIKSAKNFIIKKEGDTNASNAR